MLTREELADNVRLACRIMPEGDLTVRIVNPAPRSDWRRLVVDGPSMRVLPGPPAGAGAPGNNGESCNDRVSCGGESCNDRVSYGVAVDLGTTNISMSLWDLKATTRLSSVVGPNQQSCCGSDVMTRLISACSSKNRADEISRLAGESIEAGILDMCRKEGYDFRKIRRISIVGNTAMLALLVRKNSELLLRPDHWTAPIDCLPEDGNEWFENGCMGDDVSFEIVQPFGGFVGSDLLAGIVATGLIETTRRVCSSTSARIRKLPFGTAASSG